MLENVSGVCHIFYCDEKLQNNIQNRAKKKKDNQKNASKQKSFKKQKIHQHFIVAYNILQNYGSIKQIPFKC